jgi:hypothetical protein
MLCACAWDILGRASTLEWDGARAEKKNHESKSRPDPDPAAYLIHFHLQTFYTKPPVPTAKFLMIRVNVAKWPATMVESAQVE